jgi:hypothetical protein
MNLIFFLTGDVYKRPEVLFPNRINWDKFRRLASLNKVLYYATTKIIENKPLSTKLKIPQNLIVLEKIMKNKRVKLGRTIKAANKVLDQEPHLLLKTYRSYPFISHDIDLLVQDLERARKLFEKNGFATRLLWDRRSFYIVKEELLEIEVYDKISPGSLIFIDERLPWSVNRETLVEGVKTHLPSVEADIMTFLADANFRTYEIAFGDLLYLYKLSTEADWGLIAEQAKKHGWLIPFNNTVAILNSLHLKIYREPSPLEKYFTFKAKVDLDLPYIPPLSQVISALMKKGVLNFIKLPSYYSVRLKKRHEGLWRAYSEVLLGNLANLSLKYWNH